MSLADILKQRISEKGPLTIAEYMEAALTHPDFGYYTTRDPLGIGGDFITSPEISQVFGELIGAWLALQWQAMGAPKCTLLEMGPGRGTLMADILRATYNIPGFFEALEVVLLEASPVLEAVQRKTLHNRHAYIRWIREMENLPSRPLLFVANEFFDALPIRQFVGEEERRITWDGSAFRFLPGGTVTAESCEPAESIMVLLARHMARFGGCGLAIDYGYNGGQQADTFQAMSKQYRADVLATPGMVDLTALVDFAPLARAAESEGLAAHGPVTQGEFLLRLGAEARVAKLCKNTSAKVTENIIDSVKRLIDPAQMGEIFKVMAFTQASLPTPDGFSNAAN